MDVHGSEDDPPSVGLHNAAFGEVYVSEDIWRRRYMAPEVYGSGGDPPPCGCIKPIFNERAWIRRGFLPLDGLHNIEF